MQDFAKLFTLEGIGQVLCTLETADDDDDDETQDADGNEIDTDVFSNDLIRIRIADFGGIEFRMTLRPTTSAARRACWHGLTAATILATIRPLLDARTSIAAQA